MLDNLFRQSKLEERLNYVNRMTERFQPSAWLNQLNGLTSGLTLASRMSEALQLPKWEQASSALSIANSFTGIQKYVEENIGVQRKLNITNNLLHSLEEVSRWTAAHESIIRNATLFTPFMTRLTEIAEHMNVFEQNANKWMQNVDLTAIKIQADGLDFEDRHFSVAELAIELDSEIEEIKKHNSLYELSEKLRKKLWFIILLISLFVFIPQLIDSIVWYQEQIPKLIAMIKAEEKTASDATVYAYTINEQTPLRESANSKAKKLVWLLIDTKLRIVFDIPRWYEVEYIADDGTSLVGWVSKRSVEIESE